VDGRGSIGALAPAISLEQCPHAGTPFFDRELLDAIRELARWPDGTPIPEKDGIPLLLGGSETPVGFTNCVARTDVAALPELVLERVAEFFGPQSRDYTVWVRAHVDADLESLLPQRGKRARAESPWMFLDHRPVLAPRARDGRWAACGHGYGAADRRHGRNLLGRARAARVGRRKLLTGAAGLAAGLAAGTPADASVTPARRYRWSDAELLAKINDPVWDRESLARIEGDTAPGKLVHGYVTDTVMGVRDGEAVRPLFGFEVSSGIRVIQQPNGDYPRLCRALIFYRDLATGERMDEWTHFYTRERVRVVDVANAPFHYVISDHFPDPPNYGGLNTAKRPRRPLLPDWRIMDDDTVILTSDNHLYYRNALDPAKWPRESSGPMNRVSELFRYVIRREDIEDESKTHLPHTGVWNRVTPWLPWMLMGQAPGHILYAGTFSSVKSIDKVPANVAERARHRWPLYLAAPVKWEDPSLSSLENDARTQKPTPPRRRRRGWPPVSRRRGPACRWSRHPAARLSPRARA
jgi:hypothetical protein